MSFNYQKFCLNVKEAVSSLYQITDIDEGEGIHFLQNGKDYYIGMRDFRSIGHINLHEYGAFDFRELTVAKQLRVLKNLSDNPTLSFYFNPQDKNLTVKSSGLYSEDGFTPEIVKHMYQTVSIATNLLKKEIPFVEGEEEV